MIFEDTNGDGVADVRKIFAHVHNPLGFEFWGGGVLVTSGPDLLFLKDTNGDDRADVRYPILQGLGTSDTHHAANNLIYGPDGRHLLAERHLSGSQPRNAVEAESEYWRIGDVSIRPSHVLDHPGRGQQSEPTRHQL